MSKRNVKSNAKNLNNKRVYSKNSSFYSVSNDAITRKGQADIVKNRPIVYKKRLKKKIVPNYAVWFIIFLLILVAFSIFNFLLLPQITLKGSKTVKLDYKEKYVEKGYSAKFYGTDLTSKVKVSNDINNKKLGNYKVTYKVSNNGLSKKVTRKVIVGDYSKPKLSVDSSDIYVCPGTEFKSSKITASDNYDGDLTKKIKTIIKKDKVIYTVSDSSRNTKTVTKKIFYKDISVPIITLNGNEKEYYYIGDNYTDPGVSVSDNCDGDITSSVKTTGSVDTTKAGQYNIRYKVKDKSGNETTIERNVIVSERDSGSIIYLTFDDGPKEGTTNVILDILKEEGVPATFFVTNGGPDYLIKREYDEGHSVALHTASHNYAYVYASADNYFNDLQTVHDRVMNITGYDSRIIRFPGGGSNTISRRYNNGIMSYLTKEVQNRGFRYYDWNISSGDAESGNHTASEIASNVKNSLRSGKSNMVLMHDIKTYTRDGLRDIIKYGKEHGFTFKKIDVTTPMVTQKVNN